MNPKLGFIIVLKKLRTACMFTFLEIFSLILFQAILKKNIYVFFIAIKKKF